MGSYRGRARADATGHLGAGERHAPLDLKERESLLKTYHERTCQESVRAKIRARLLDHNLLLALSIAREYYNWAEWGDVQGVAVEGLCKAIDYYNPRRSDNFTDFAKRVIRKHLSRDLRIQASTFKAPKAVHDALLVVSHAAEQFKVGNGRDATPEELKALCPRRTSVAYTQAERWPKQVELSEAVEETSADPAADPEQRVLSETSAAVGQKAVRKLLSSLTAEERLVIEHSLGLGARDPLPLAEIGKLLTPPRRRQYVAEVRKGALEKMKEHPSAKDLLAATREDEDDMPTS